MQRVHVNWFHLLLLGGAVYIISQISSIYLPLLLSMVLSFILNPLVNTLAAMPLGPLPFKLPRSVAVLLSFIITALVFAGIAAFMFFPFVVEFNKFITDLPILLHKFKNLSFELQQNASQVEIPDNVHALLEQMLGTATSFTVDIAKKSVDAIFSMASRVIELIVVPVLTYYFLKDGQQLKMGLLHMLPATAQYKACSVIEEMAIVISSYIRGQMLISVVMGVMIFLGMYMLDVEYPMVLGLLGMLTETIPIVGPIVGAIPALLLAFMASNTLALKVLVFYLVIHQIENHIVVPNIMGQSIDLHPVVIIISLLIGGKLFGIVGMILAVPAAALLRVLIKHVWSIKR